MIITLMVAFTGFSTTADLTQNSDMEYVIDVDIGINEALLVETGNVSYSKALEVNNGTFTHRFMQSSIEQPGFTQSNFKDERRVCIDKPPLLNIDRLIYRSARDGLTS